MRNPHARFVATAAFVLVVLAVVPALNTILLWRSGELMPLDQVVRILNHTNAIYGTAVHGVRREIALEIAKYRQPEIISLGSSRAMDMRQEFFTRRFSCACGVMDSIDDADVFLKELLTRTQPKLALFALDFWWFTTERPQLSGALNLTDPIRLTREKVMRPYRWLERGEISLARYIDLLGGASDVLSVTRHAKIGVMARNQGIGLRGDGSQLNGLQFSPEAIEFYRIPREAIQRPVEYVSAAQYERHGPDFRYGPDKTLVRERLDAFEAAVQRLRQAGVHVIAYFPPLAPSVYQAMVASGHHGYLNALSWYFRSSGVEFYDFHDPTVLGSNLCEFADTHHSGNTTYLRILREILRRNPVSPLAGYVDSQALSTDIQRFRNTTIARYQPELYPLEEVDFLEAGCRR